MTAGSARRVHAACRRASSPADICLTNTASARGRMRRLPAAGGRGVAWRRLGCRPRDRSTRPKSVSSHPTRRSEHMNRTPAAGGNPCVRASAGRARARPARGAVPAAAQKTELLVYTALETDQIKAYEEGFKKANPNIDSSGSAIRPASSPRSSSPRRRTRRPISSSATSASSLAVFAQRRHAAAVRAQGSRQDLAAVPRSAQSARLGRHGRLRRGDLLQHRRGGEAQPAQARDRGRT